jgi:ubiquinone/menaquinone biosynthesis C-methylase UbiE
MTTAAENTINWEDLSRLGKLRAVIDPNDKMGLKNMLIDRVHWNSLRRHLKGSRNILDFGCGTGRFARRIHGMGMDYIGIDNSNGMIRAARDWNGGTQVTFQHFDGSKIPFSDASFDTVIVARVFIHLLKTAQFNTLLTEIRRVLKPKGRLILLEEASLSGRKSGQAKWSLTEEDFRSALSSHFTVAGIEKVRSSEFSKLSRRLTEYGELPYVWFRLILRPLSLFESYRVSKLKNDYFAKVTYYDVLIDAVARS